MGFYGSTGIKTILADLRGWITQKLGLKANVSDVPTKVSDLQNDSGFQANTIESISVNGTGVSPDVNKNVALTVMTNAVNDLLNYYLKTETYTKTEVDTLIAAITSINFEVVSQLPTSDISTTTIYLVPSGSPDPTKKDVKDEYICLDTTTTPATWERIGSTDIDLSGYVTTSALNTALADYQTKTLATALVIGGTSYSTVEAALGALNTVKANTSDLGTAAAKGSTNTVSSGSTDLVESGAVYTAINTAIGNAVDNLLDTNF